ncbi:zinc finger protein, putative [Plasmodium ovale]|uniref:Zinc finger protein, putative n=1 Tax=Plasmodium ovale TaxID=36330 RepID=A0A1D3U804_PLAOA|nr:zinc finger protein, putative [Plasmodium ovale]
MLYKTQLCSFYAKGICARGNKCSWAHGELDVRPMPKFYKTRMCYTFLSGSYCEASKCTFAHTEEELRGSGKALRLCTKFFLDGYCNKEDKCPMAHNINQLDPSVKFTSTELMNGVCDDEESERCKNHLGSKNSQGEEIGSKPNNVHMNSCSMKNGNINSVKNVNMGTTNVKSMGANLKSVGADVKSVGIDVKNVGENVKSNLNNNVNDSSSGDSNMYDAKSDEENNKVVHNMVNLLNNNGKRDPQGPKKNTLNFCRYVDNKAYKEFLLEGNLASDIFDETKRRDVDCIYDGEYMRMENMRKGNFMKNELRKNNEYIQRSGNMLSNGISYNKEEFMEDGQNARCKLYTYKDVENMDMFRNYENMKHFNITNSTRLIEHYKNISLIDANVQNGENSVEKMTCLRKIDELNLRQNGLNLPPNGINLSQNGMNLQQNGQTLPPSELSIPPGVNCTLTVDALKKLGKNNMNMQEEKYIYRKMKKKENSESIFFDSNTTKYENAKNVSNYNNEDIINLNRTKENLDNSEDFGMYFNNRRGITTDGGMNSLGAIGGSGESGESIARGSNSRSSLTNVRSLNTFGNINNLNGFCNRNVLNDLNAVSSQNDLNNPNCMNELDLESLVCSFNNLSLTGQNKGKMMEHNPMRINNKGKAVGCEKTNIDNYKEEDMKPGDENIFSEDIYLQYGTNTKYDLRKLLLNNSCSVNILNECSELNEPFIISRSANAAVNKHNISNFHVESMNSQNGVGKISGIGDVNGPNGSKEADGLVNPNMHPLKSEVSAFGNNRRGVNCAVHDDGVNDVENNMHDSVKSNSYGNMCNMNGIITMNILGSMDRMGNMGNMGNIHNMVNLSNVCSMGNMENSFIEGRNAKKTEMVSNKVGNEVSRQNFMRSEFIYGHGKNEHSKTNGVEETDNDYDLKGVSNHIHESVILNDNLVTAKKDETKVEAFEQGNGSVSDMAYGKNMNMLSRNGSNLLKSDQVNGQNNIVKSSLHSLGERIESFEDVKKMFTNDNINSSVNYDIDRMFLNKKREDKICSHVEDGSNGTTDMHNMSRRNFTNKEIHYMEHLTSLGIMCSGRYGNMSPEEEVSREMHRSGTESSEKISEGSSAINSNSDEHLHSAGGSSGRGVSQSSVSNGYSKGEIDNLTKYNYANYFTDSNKNRYITDNSELYDISYKSDDNFSGYIYNNQRGVTNCGKNANGMDADEPNGTCLGSKGGKKFTNNYNPLTYSFSGLCECLGKGDDSNVNE